MPDTQPYNRPNILRDVETVPNFLEQDGDPLYKLETFKSRAGYVVEELIPEKVWAVYNTIHDVVMEYSIVQWVSEDDNSVYVEPFWTGFGITGHLRELRHSWFGSAFDGYVFYAKTDHIRAACEFLERHFDSQ
jgi:hypothetical protein